MFSVFQRVPAILESSLPNRRKIFKESELSDILSSLVQRNLLDPKRDTFPFPRGRPTSDTKTSGLAEERRGALSYYTRPQVKDKIDKILENPKCIELIDNAILSSEIFYSFLKYCFEVHFYQIKESEPAFLNSMRPAIRKYGYKNVKELDSSYIFAKDLTPDKIKRLAKGYALKTISNFQQDGKNILYAVAGLFSLLKVYDSDKGEKA